jgi:transposase InsO family protein
MARYAASKDLRRECPLRVPCRLPGVSTSGFHARLTREPSRCARARERLKLAAQAARRRTRQTYGAQRLQRELAADGFRVSLGTVKRVRREPGLRCVRQKKRCRVQTTDSAHALPPAPNLLEQESAVKRPDAVRTADIRYVPTAEGWLYLAAIKDLFAGEGVTEAVSARRPAEGLIHHSGRGSQYCGHEYQALLTRHGLRASMSRKGDCYDGAPVESSFGTLKTELVHHRRYETRAEAEREITEYVDLFYNRQRRQARLGYLSPAADTQQFTRRQQAA